MSDKSQQIVLDALRRAVADPAGLPLHSTKTAPGLFTATAPGKQAAQACKEQNYLHVVRTETKGKTVQEICAITEKGIAFLLGQVNPKEILESFVQALESRQGQVAELLAAAQQTQTSLESLKTTAEKVLAQVQAARGKTPAVVGINGDTNGNEAWKPAILNYLGQWHASGNLEDCPLPDLFRKAREVYPSLTVGQFHDGIRNLHGREKIYLHPWTGPLYEIPEPSIALLSGHEVAYYASRRVVSG